MLKVSLIIFLILASGLELEAQISVKFSVVDSADHALQNCNVKISGNKSNLIYGYFSMNSANSFSRSLVINNGDDSLLLSLTHISYQDTTLKFLITPVINAGVIKLPSKSYLLKEVQIKGSPIWKEGDTTNYRVDDFKTGDEKKLKDVLANLPGFSVKDDGTLMFRNKRVGKIFIDGQEIFADNVSLLLNSFPSGVIELVQAQENQNENRLLKKIGGSDTYINLTLKKGTFKAAFGDFEAGIGQKGRYKLAPVIFSISKQLKAGYIGNINSVGEGIGWSALRNVKGAQEYDSQDILSPDQTPYSIRNLPERYYLKNRLFDNRIDLSSKLSNKLTLKTTIAAIFDRQAQHTGSLFNYFSGTTYTSRTEDKNIAFSPSIINVGQVYSYSINDSNDLQVKLNLFIDESKSASSSMFNGDNLNESINGIIKKNWHSPTIQIRHTHLSKNNRAVVTSFSYNKQWLRENGQFNSDKWSQIFSLPDSSYRTLSQTPDHSVSNWKIQQSRFLKFRKWSFNTSLTIGHSELTLKPHLTIADSLNKSDLITPSLVNLTGAYKTSTILGELNGKLNYSNQGKITYKVSAGVDQLQRSEMLLKESKIYPKVKLSLSGETNFIHALKDYLTLGYEINPPTLYDLYTINLSQLPLTIRRNSMSWLGSKDITANYIFSILNKRDLSNVQFSIFYTRHLNSPVYNILYKGFLPVTTDSVINRGRNDLGFTSNIKIPSLLLMAVIDMETVITATPYFYDEANQILRGTNLQLMAKASIKKNWSQKYYVTASVSYSENTNKHQRTGNTLQQSNRFGSFIGGLKQRFIFSKNFNAIVNTQFANTGLYAQQPRSSFFLIDSELNVKLTEQSPITITLNADNLTDQRSYIIANNGVASQLVSTIPMIGRNLFVSARFVF